MPLPRLTLLTRTTRSRRACWRPRSGCRFGLADSRSGSADRAQAASNPVPVRTPTVAPNRAMITVSARIDHRRSGAAPRAWRTLRPINNMLIGRGQPKPPGVTCRIVSLASWEIRTCTRNSRVDRSRPRSCRGGPAAGRRPGSN